MYETVVPQGGMSLAKISENTTYVCVIIYILTAMLEVGENVSSMFLCTWKPHWWFSENLFSTQRCRSFLGKIC